MKVDLIDESGDIVPDPTTINADIKSGFVHYRKGRLVLRANFVDLKRDPSALTNFTGMIRTNERRHWFYDVTTSPSRYAGHDTLESGSGRRTCEIGHMFDYTANFALLRALPRLGRRFRRPRHQTKPKVDTSSLPS